MTKSIDKIREQVERVREEHRQHVINFAVGSDLIVCGKCDAPADGYILWPCPTLRLAEKMLKLAEGLEAVKADASIYAIPKIERILAEVAE